MNIRKYVFIASLSILVMTMFVFNFVFATGTNISLNPSSITTINSSSTSTITADASGYTGLTLSFDYDVTNLDATGDSLIYSWSTGTSPINVLGTKNGQTGSTTLSGDTGTISIGLPVGAQDANLNINFTNTGNTTGDTVSITNLSLTGTLATTTQTLSMPSNLNITNLGTTTLTLNWDNVSGAIFYSILQDDLSIGTTSLNNLNISGLVASSTYSFKVVATDGVNFATSSALQVTTLDATSSSTTTNSGSGSGSTTTLTPATIVVTPSNLQGWVGIDDNGNGGSVSYVTGPGAAPLGTGSAELAVSTSTQGYLLALGNYGGVPLSKITTFDYSTYVQSGNNTIAPSIQLDITKDVSSTTLGWQGRLVYEPYMNGTVIDGQWQNWQTISGKWWLSHSSSQFDNNCGQSSPCTFAELINLYPNIGIIPGSLQMVGFKAGSGWTNFIGNIDDLHIVTDTADNTYDFEPDPILPPAIPTITLEDANSNSINDGGVIHTENFTFTLSDTSNNVDHYQLKYWNDITSSIYKVGSPWSLTNISGYSTSPAQLDKYVDHFSQGEGTHYFEFSACDVNNLCSPFSSDFIVTYTIPSPSAPINLRWLNSSNQALTATNVDLITPAWDAPNTTDEPILNYEYSYSFDGGNTWSSNPDIVSTTSIPNQAFGGAAIGTEAPWVFKVRSVGDNGRKSDWAISPIITYDITAPATTNILTPTPRQWFQTTPINNSWTTVTKDVKGNIDLSGIDHYQIAYAYDDGHTFGGSTCLSVPTIDGLAVSGCRDVNGTSRSHVPALNEEGGVTIWVRVIDKAGNIGAWSRSVHYYYDHTAPTTTISISPVVNGKFTVSGTATDNLALNRVFMQFLKDGISRCGGDMINLITYPFATSTNWSKNYDISSLYKQFATTTLCGTGNYQIDVVVKDMAGNSLDTGWTSNFIVTDPAPAKPILLSPSDGSIVNGSSITQAWSDTSDDVDHYIYESYNNSSATSLRFHAEYSTTSKTATNVANITYWWRVKAVDGASNQSDWSDLWKIIVDNNKPIAQITSATEVDNATETFSGYITDTNLNYYYCWLTKKDDSTEIEGTRNSNCVTTWANGADHFGSSTAPVELGGFDISDLDSGDYTIHLIAVDKANNKSIEATKDITITKDEDEGGEGDGNQSPIASFTIDSSNDPEFLFTSTATDTDGNIVSSAWDFGDGSTSSSTTANHTYQQNGVYNVVLTVTDNSNLSASSTQSINVNSIEDNSTSSTSTSSNNNEGSGGTGGGGGALFIQPLISSVNGGSVLGASAFQFTLDLKLGSIGEEVKALQEFLNLKGFKLTESGPGSPGQETNYFGFRTRDALKRYQEANPIILTNVGITDGVGTGNFFWSTRGFVNNILLNDASTSEYLTNH